MSETILLKRTDFPPDFLFGTATSSYQIEGAKFGDCGRSHWDTFAATPGNVARGENGEVACDHYNRFEADFDLIRNAGFDCYRFSTSWARVMPDGLARELAYTGRPMPERSWEPQTRGDLSRCELRRWRKLRTKIGDSIADFKILR